jgi:NADH:ubiquinone oxidoreductase subunit 5 (subunit L)/multisubunit Na+/H+ antiporter MnhA subunit
LVFEFRRKKQNFTLIKNLGYSWVRWCFVFAEVITAAAVLRGAGYIFFGWGPQERREESNNKEKPETEQGNDRVPTTMFVPALLLVIAGSLLGLAPGLRPAVLRHAAMFQNSAAYAARVLDGGSFPDAPASFPLPPAEMLPLC